VDLATLLAKRREDLIHAWRRRLVGAFAPGAVPALEITNSLPLFIDELVQWLGEGVHGGDLRPRSRVARLHGEQRYRSGFDLRSVVREYGVLRECIIDLVEESRGGGLSLEEDRILTRALGSAVADAAEQFHREHEAALARHASEHFAFLAHELRNPLGSARLALDLLTRTSPGGRGRHAEILGRSLARVQRLLDDTLVQAQVATLGPAVALTHELVHLDALAAEVLAETQLDADAKGVRLERQLEPGLALEGEPRLLRSIISNLVRNGVKFSAPGGVVQVRAARAEGRVSVEVEDSCGGLPPGAAEELFAPFRQHGADRTGFGLGLAITKQAVDAHQGAIQAHSLPGKGCVFLVTFPAPGDLAPTGG
jgi:signal transduction histidine kinase